MASPHPILGAISACSRLVAGFLQFSLLLRLAGLRWYLWWCGPEGQLLLEWFAFPARRKVTDLVEPGGGGGGGGVFVGGWEEEGVGVSVCGVGGGVE